LDFGLGQSVYYSFSAAWNRIEQAVREALAKAAQQAEPYANPVIACS